MKKNILTSMAAVAAFALTACNNAAPKMDEQPAVAPEGGMKIAYVEVDSLASQYQFCIDYTKILEKKRTNATNTLNQKGNQLQAAMNNFQQKLNNNGFRSREEAESAQLAIQRSQQSLQELQARLGSELEKEAADFSLALKDSLDHFLAVYNKDKKFDLILSKSERYYHKEWNLQHEGSTFLMLAQFPAGNGGSGSHIQRIHLMGHWDTNHVVGNGNGLMG